MSNVTSSSSYIAPYVVEMFNSVPRFGHSIDLPSVIMREEGWEDYAQGVVMIGAIIIAMFAIWLILEILSLCYRFCISGRRMKAKNYNQCYRLLVLASSILSFLVGIAFLFEGTAALEETFSSVRSNVDDLATMAKNVTNITERVIQVGNDTIPVRNQVVEVFSNGVCNSFPGGNGETIDFDTKALQIMGQLSQLSDFTQGDLTNLKNSFEKGFVEAEAEINLVLEKAQDYSRISYYAYAVIFLAFLISLQGYAAWSGLKLKVFFGFQSMITIPIYSTVLFLSTIVAAGLSSVLVVNTDICVGTDGNPESFLRSIMNKISIDDYGKQIMEYYILTGCEGNFEGLNIVNQLVDDMKDGNQAVVDLDIVLETEQSTFETLCGGGDGSLDGLKTSLRDVNVAFSSLLTSAEDARALLQCEPINALYKDFFHGDVCENLPNTISWMFVTALLVVVFGIIIFTLRGALYPPVDDEEGEYDENDGSINEINERGTIDGIKKVGENQEDYKTLYRASSVNSDDNTADIEMADIELDEGSTADIELNEESIRGIDDDASDEERLSEPRSSRYRHV